MVLWNTVVLIIYPKLVSADHVSIYSISFEACDKQIIEAHIPGPQFAIFPQRETVVGKGLKWNFFKCL